MYKSSAQISLHLLPGFEFLKIKSVLYDTDNTPKNVTAQMYFFSRSSPCQVCDNNGKQPSDLYSFFRSEGNGGWRMAQWIIPEITEMTLQIQLALRTHCWNTLTQDEYLGWLLIKLQLSVHKIYIVNIFLVAKATLEMPG